MLIFTVLFFLIFKSLFFILLLWDILLDFTRHCEYGRLNKFLLIHRNLIMMIDINQGPVLCRHTNKTLTSQYSRQLLGNSLLCRPTLIRYIAYVPYLRLIKRRDNKLGLNLLYVLIDLTIILRLQLV